MRTALIVLLFGIIAAPQLAFAHAFGQQFTLPLPVNLYLIGGVIAFLISCVLISFAGNPTSLAPERVLPLSERAADLVRTILELILLCGLTGGIALGLFGVQSAYFNPLTYIFWIGLILMIPYLSVLIGGIWEAGNPFKALLSLISPALPEGKRVWNGGYLPALIAYVLLIILELFFPEVGTEPRFLAVLLLGYAIYLAACSFRYGAKDWYRFADAFSVFIGLAGKLAPIRLKERAVVFGSPVPGLVNEAPKHISLVLFVLFALAATAYDGFRETTAMLNLILNVLQTPWLPTSFAIFLAFPFMFFLFYAGALLAMKMLAKGSLSLKHYLLRFSYSLIPILFAYHFAHYFSLMTNSFGILIGADIIWYIQLAVIVLGHTFAAYVAHRIALNEFKEKRTALISQLPLVLLMVFYTAFGLWILAQPFAGGAL